MTGVQTCALPISVHLTPVMAIGGSAAANLQRSPPTLPRSLRPSSLVLFGALLALAVTGLKVIAVEAQPKDLELPVLVFSGPWGKLSV